MVQAKRGGLTSPSTSAQKDGYKVHQITPGRVPFHCQSAFV